MNKNYFTYLMRSHRGFVLFSIIINLFVILTAFLSLHMGADKVISSLFAIAIIAGTMTFALPPLLLRYVHDKKAVDAYFAIPISRREMLNTTLIYGLLVILVPFVLFSTSVWLVGILKAYEISVELIPYLLCMILALSSLFVMHCCLFLLANSLFDGIVMMFAYAFAPAVLAMCVGSFISNCIYAYNSFDYGWITALSLTYETVFNGSYYLMDYAHEFIDLSRWIVTSVIYLVIGYWGLSKSFVNRKTERAESISNGKLSYPLVIAYYAIGLLLAVAFEQNNSFYWFLYFVIFVAYTVANFVYRRKVQIRIRDILLFVAGIILSMILSTAAYKTRGFHLSYLYDHQPHDTRYILNYSSYKGYDYMDDELDSEFVELMKRNGIQTDDIYGYSLEAEIDVDALTAENKVIVDSMNGYRDGFIDEYYEAKNIENYYAIDDYCSLSVIDHINSNKNSREYYYSGRINVPQFNDFKVLCRYTEVMLYIYSDSDVERWYSLNDLLSSASN